MTGLSDEVSAWLGAAASLVGVITGVVVAARYVAKKALKKNESPSGDPALRTAKRIRDNLPPLAPLVGRQTKAQELFKKVNDYHMVFLHGVGGIGKSTLAVAVARRYRQKKRAHVIWITCKNEVLTLDKILNAIARFFDFTGIDSLEIDAKQDKILRVLGQSRSLLVIDNFESIENDSSIIAFLNLIGEKCRVLITSRNCTVVSADQANLQVDALTDRDAILLMRKELEKNGRPDLSGEEYETLLEAIGGSPLAIKWSIGQIATSGHTVGTICAQLKDGGAAGSTELFENIFGMAWQELNGVQKDALYLLQFLVTPVSAEALRGMSGMADETQFISEISKLLRLSLIESTASSDGLGRSLSMHSLTSSFVSAELKKIANGDGEIAKRILVYYREFCSERSLLPHGKERDYGDLEREWKNVNKAIRYSIDHIDKMGEQDSVKNDALDISRAINVFLWSRGHWQERIDVCKRALGIAESLDRREEAGQFACFIGIVLFWQGKNDEAASWAVRARDLLADSTLGKRILGHRLEGLIRLGNQDYDGAINGLEEVFAVASSENDVHVTHDDIAVIADWVASGPEGYKAGRIALLQEIGICCNRKGDFASALASLRHSESLARSISDDEGLSVSLSHLGHALVGLEMYREAATAYKEGLEIALSIGRRSTTARCYEGLARIARRRWNVLAMLRNGSKALVLYEQLNMQSELNDVVGTMTLSFFEGSKS